MSGWNWFVKTNRVLEQLYHGSIITPPRTDVLPIQGLSIADNSGGSATATWTGGTQGASYKVYCVSRLITVDEYATAYDIESDETVLVSAETLALTLVASKTFDVAIAVEETVTHAFSIASRFEIVMGA